MVAWQGGKPLKKLVIDVRLTMLVCSLLFLSAAFTLKQEADIFIHRLVSDKDISLAAGQGELPEAISSYSKSIALRDCLSSHAKLLRQASANTTEKSPS